MQTRPTGLTAAVLLGLAALCGATAVSAAETPPNLLLITIDTLRADRLSSYGYERNTSPNLDRLINDGVRFTQARTVEPLTGPALCSLLTSRYPHDHGASRNGLRMREGLQSLPLLLKGHGYRGAAFVANWTLKDKVTGLAEHWEEYEVILNRKRWFGLVSSEANADDVTGSATEWLDGHVEADRGAPFFLWVHYVEPHAPYRLHKQHLDALGMRLKGDHPPEDRYDTEIAEVDRSVGVLLARLAELGLSDNTMVAFAADHGESLGEHNYWGHGRHLYEPTLHIPMSVTWRGRVEPATIDGPALIIDLAPTIAGLLGREAPEGFTGFDWSEVIAGRTASPDDRVTYYQAHKGVVISDHDSDLARRSGLLEIGLIERGLKEIIRVKNGRHWRFDLNQDPTERINLVELKSGESERLLEWKQVVVDGLGRLDRELPQPLDEESAQRLRALGYAD